MGCRYRVWIVQYQDGLSEERLARGGHAVAVEPAESQVMTARQARHYVEAFNQTAEHEARNIRAAAFPVTVRYGGEPKRGQAITAVPENFRLQAHKKSPLTACQESASNGLPPREST